MTQPITHPLSLSEVQAMVADAFVNFFARQRRKAQRIDERYDILWHSLETLSQAGGKRLRPYLLLVTYQGLSDKPVENILPVATGQELLHLAMLIHDDIVDRDQVRYGVPNISGQYDIVYSPLLDNPKERRHFAEGAALLAGDVAIAGTYELISESSLPSDEKLLAVKIINDAIFNVAGGQLLDTEAAFRPFHESDAIKIGTYKTATYSFVSPLDIATRLAGASPAVRKSLTRFGRSLGIAYQLTDDLLGVFGDEAATGKSAIGDLREGKHTYMVEQFYRLASPVQKREFDRHFGKPTLHNTEATILRSLLTETGARQQTEQYITDYAAQAHGALQEATMKPLQKEALSSLVTTCTKRTF